MRAKRRRRRASKLNELKRQAPGAARDPVSLDDEAARLELAGESADELVAAAGGGRHVLVEHREVGAAAT